MLIKVSQVFHKGNILAEIYMIEFDKKFNDYPNVFCIRYVDDILTLRLCSSNNNSEVLEGLNFELKRNLCLLLRIAIN